MKASRKRLTIGLASLAVLHLAGFVTMAVAQQQQPLVFDPDHQPAIVLTTPELSAQVVAQPGDPQTGQTRSITLKSSVGEATVDLPFQFAQVNALAKGPSGKLVVVGMVTGSVWEVGIVDMTAARLIDKFMCYSPAVSPDGAYIAFIKMFGPHSARSPADDVMLYDVALNPAANRPSGISLDDEINVGFELYPWGNGTTADNEDVPTQSANIVGGGGQFLWKDCEFFFWSRASGKYQIVRVVIAGQGATVSSSPLPESGLGPARESLAMFLEDVTDEGGMVKATLSFGSSHTFPVSAPEFKRLGTVDLSALPAK